MYRIDILHNSEHISKKVTSFYMFYYKYILIALHKRIAKLIHIAKILAQGSHNFTPTKLTNFSLRLFRICFKIFTSLSLLECNTLNSI